MLLHEAAHLIAALCIGLKVSHIKLQPFGVNLKLKNKIVFSLADEIILYISGPLFNAVAAIAAAAVNRAYPFAWAEFLYITNIMLFAMNMLPALPLDGGIILKKILARAIGEKKSMNIMRKITVIISLMLAACGAYVLFITKMNFSVLLFSLIMAGNALSQGEKYDADFVRELMFYSKKKKDKIKHIVTRERDCSVLAENLDKNRYTVIYITDENGKIEDILTEEGIINSLTGNKFSDK
jgi:stage IV sporulation protein FB